MLTSQGAIVCKQCPISKHYTNTVMILYNQFTNMKIREKLHGFKVPNRGVMI